MSKTLSLTQKEIAEMGDKSQQVIGKTVGSLKSHLVVDYIIGFVNKLKIR